MKKISTISKQTFRAFRIIIIYTGISFLWIYTSDSFVSSLNISYGAKTVLSMIKGWLFIIATALLLFQLIRRALKEQVAIQKKLHESELRHTHLFKHSMDGIFYSQPNGKILSANDVACKILGMPESEIIKGGIDLIADQKDPRFVLAYNALNRNGFYNGELNYKRKNGELFPVELTISTFVEESGAELAFIVFRDITERKRIESEKKRWADAFENCAHGIVLAEPETNKITACNGAFAHLHKTTIKEIVGSSIYKIYPASELENVKRSVTRADQFGYASFESFMMRKDGSTFPVQIDVVSVKDNNGKIEYRVGTIQDITERKHAEEELRKSELRFRNLVDHAPEGIFIKLKGKYFFMNDTGVNILGYSSAAELVGLDVVDQAHDDFKEEVIAREKLLNAGVKALPLSVQYIRKKDGTYIWVETATISFPIGNEDGALIFFRDITDKKHAEEEYKKSELRFQQLVDKAPDAIFIQLDGKFLYVNQSTVKLYGYNSGSEMIGETIINHVHPDYRSIVQKRIQILNNEKVPVPVIEQMMLKKDGSIIWVEASAIPFQTNDKNGALVFLRDITAKKFAESELEKSQDLVRLAGEMANIGGWEFDAVTGEGTWTDEIARIHDVDPADSTNKEIGLSVYSGIHRIKIENAIREAIEFGKPYDIELEMTSKKGIHKWVKTKGFPVLENGKVIKLRGSFQDITDLKLIQLELEKHRNHLSELVESRTEELDIINRRLMEEIERERQMEALLRDSLQVEKDLNEMKGRFISTVSHEFRTPLTSVLTSIELMERYGDKWDKAKTVTHYDRIKNSVSYLTKLLDDVTLINRSDSNNLEILLSNIDLEKLCSGLVAEFKDYLDENISLEYSFTGEQKEFDLDIKLMRSILNNLLSNAIKYSPYGGKIIFDVNTSDKEIRITVSDQGIGIPKEDFPHMFDRFHRAENAKDIKGTGLGLSIVKRAVELHKGKINFDSHVGKGTKFVVTIPKE